MITISIDGFYFSVNKDRTDGLETACTEDSDCGDQADKFKCESNKCVCQDKYEISRRSLKCGKIMILDITGPDLINAFHSDRFTMKICKQGCRAIY